MDIGEVLRTASQQPPKTGLLLFEIADRIGLDVSKWANRKALKFSQYLADATACFRERA